MKVLAVLWTICLVKLCNAGCFGGKRKTDKKDIVIIAVDQPLELPPPTEPKTLDLACLKDPRYKTVDVNIDGVPARVYIFSPKEDIKKVRTMRKTYGRHLGSLEVILKKLLQGSAIIV
ncbi:signal peptide containing protein [Theileria equi strain WA]|uniref:Signal peptide containing protein n=1 Tax=Theileria equi strain WA TaxID=1537102 RepID=L1LAX9_THEEQ|nr:signal peptide containing protein [Theileria equi strain WA]EKX72612.1 signal peptide containing protein [Theileria equi strain WA]|eukprot:XP_004832064.1 signal peptide containing protein [Theileria equi strain WA]